MSATPSNQFKRRLKTTKRFQIQESLCLPGGVFDGNKRKFISGEIIPERPLKKSYYRCSNYFETRMLRDLMIETEKYGLIMLTGSETRFFLFDELEYQMLSKITIDLPTNTSRGGQSQARIGRLRDEKIHHYLKSIGERCIQYYSKDGIQNVKKFIIMGNGELKTKIADSKYIHFLNSNRTIMTLESIVPFEQIRPILENENIFNKEQESELKEFDNLMETNPNLLVFGQENTIKALDENLLKKVIISEENEISIPNSVKTIKTNSFKIKQFGGIVGILHFEMDLTEIFEEM